MTLRNFASITLRDGRKLAFREYGQGFPVIFLHGNLNSRLFAPCWGKTEEVTADAGCKVIAVDRPGYGDSCFHPNRQYSDVAADVTELLDHLQLERAAVVGYSSGGPNAMACAANIAPSRLAALGLISSDGPYAQMGASVVQQMYHLTEEEVAETAGGALTPAMSLVRAEKNFNDLRGAFESLSKPDRRELALADLEHAASQGLDKGPSQDALLESAPWDFSLEQLCMGLDQGSVPCLLWHGEQDTDVPVSVAQYLVERLERLPGAQTRLVPGESHSMIRRKWGEFLTNLVASAASVGK